MDNGSQRSKKKSGMSRHRRSVFMIAMILVFLSSVLAVGSVSLHAKNEEYKAQEEELLKKISAEEKRAQEVAEFSEYVKTDDYIKEVAEDKLDLVDPNEIIFRPAK